jgi:hypothetical protein
MEGAYLAVLVAVVLGIAAVSLYVAYLLVARTGVNKRRGAPARGVKR